MTSSGLTKIRVQMPLNIDRLVAMLSSLGSLFWCLVLLLPNVHFKPLQHSFIEKKLI